MASLDPLNTSKYRESHQETNSKKVLKSKNLSIFSLFDYFYVEMPIGQKNEKMDNFFDFKIFLLLIS